MNLTLEPQLVSNYDPGIKRKVTSLLIQEKYDGIRALWDGFVLRTKTGHVIKVPAWWSDTLPTFPLDGELWMGRGTFQRLTSVVKTGSDKEWAEVSFVVFDAPTFPGPYVSRYEALRMLHQHHTEAHGSKSNLEIVDSVPCLGHDHLFEEFTRVCRAGGEGLILRDPDAPYTPGRSAGVWKFLSASSDEAKVVGHEMGKGRLDGKVGALVLNWNGIRFSCGSGMTDADRENPPPIGAVVTFEYKNRTTSGSPRQPIFKGVRDYE
jgi:DNA ligase 1